MNPVTAPTIIDRSYIHLFFGVTLFVLLHISIYVSAKPDTSRFNQFLGKGNSVYSRKQGYASFRQSLRYFDSAQVIAEQNGTTAMLAAASFARGRVYDAWNKEPDKTIELYQKASKLFKLAGDEYQYLYTKHLIAHAYDKSQDSTHTIAILRELVSELAEIDASRLNKMNFIPEMALIATEVRNYSLANDILKKLTRRELIINDPETYNYLDHYYLTQSRLDVYWKKKNRAAYIDSLAIGFGQLSGLTDKLYYAHQLAELYGAVKEYSKAYRYSKIELDLQSQLFSGNDFEQMQHALSLSEIAAERRKSDYEVALSRSRKVALWSLSFLLAVITVLSMYLYRRNIRYKAQSLNLRHLNTELDKHVSKVELLNKEMQHRIRNNLYTIYSLLHMQQDSTDNEEVIAHLEAARMRVESVAALHDHLQTENEQVDLAAYIRVLVNKVVSCLANQRKVVTHISAEPMQLPINICFALSLILNEWITNSIKYASGNEEVLNMDVHIRNSGNALWVVYHDDGRPEGNQHKGTGLGSEIIRLLTLQLKGTLTTPENNPYHYNLFIPYD